MEKQQSTAEEELIGEKTATYINSFLCLICFQLVTSPVQCVCLCVDLIEKLCKALL